MKSCIFSKMIFRYGTIILLISLGIVDNHEFRINDRSVRAEMRINRRRLLRDREREPEPVYNDDLSRLLTEFGGVHTSRLLKDLGGLNGDQVNSLGLSFRDLSALAVAFRDLGGTNVNFDDVERLLIEVERSGFLSGENGVRIKDDMMEAIKVMTEENMRRPVNDGMNIGVTGVNEEDLNLLLQAIMNGDTKKATTITHKITKAEENKREGRTRGKHIERTTEIVDSSSFPTTPNDQQKTPTNMQPRNDNSVNEGEIIELLSLLETLNQLESLSVDEGNGRANNGRPRTNLAESIIRGGVNIIREGGSIIREGAGAALGFGLGSLITLAGLNTFGAAVTLAQSNLARNRPINVNNHFVRTDSASTGNIDSLQELKHDQIVINSPEVPANSQTFREVGSKEFRNIVPIHSTIDPINGLDVQLSTTAYSQNDRPAQFEGTNNNRNSPISQTADTRSNADSASGDITRSTISIANSNVQNSQQPILSLNENGSNSVPIIEGTGDRSQPSINQNIGGNEHIHTGQTFKSNKEFHPEISSSQRSLDSSQLHLDLNPTTTRPQMRRETNERISSNPQTLPNGSPSTSERFDVNQGNQRIFHANSNQRTSHRFRGQNIPADILFRAAVFGESPAFVFGQAPVQVPPTIHRGIVSHIGSFSSRGNQQFRRTS